MAQPATIVDVGAGEVVKHGSQTVTFTPPGGGTTQVLVCEDITYSKDTREIDQMDEAGKASKSAYVSTKGKGTMTVQIKAAITRLTAGFTGSFLDTDGSTAIPFIVIACGPRYQQAEATKINISIAEKLN